MGHVTFDPCPPPDPPQYCKAEPEADLSEYGRAWAVHQLVPFVDKLLGISGAMDNRMVGQPYDWWLRLPMALLSLALPNECVLLIAHLVNIATWFERMPGVWDYMVWCAIMEVTFVRVRTLSLTRTLTRTPTLTRCSRSRRPSSPRGSCASSWYTEIWGDIGRCREI